MVAAATVCWRRHSLFLYIHDSHHVCNNQQASVHSLEHEENATVGVSQELNDLVAQQRDTIREQQRLMEDIKKRRMVVEAERLQMERNGRASFYEKLYSGSVTREDLELYQTREEIAHQLRGEKSGASPIRSPNDRRRNPPRQPTSPTPLSSLFTGWRGGQRGDSAAPRAEMPAEPRTSDHLSGAGTILRPAVDSTGGVAATSPARRKFAQASIRALEQSRDTAGNRFSATVTAAAADDLKTASGRPRVLLPDRFRDGSGGHAYTPQPSISGGTTRAAAVSMDASNFIDGRLRSGSFRTSFTSNNNILPAVAVAPCTWC